MQIGLFAPLVHPFATRDYLARFGPAAEERGFHSIWVGEHVLLFDEYASRYPYAGDGEMPGGPRNGMLEPFTTLAFLAATTRRIRLGTAVCLVPQRHPIYTAKEGAAIDWLSEGRFDFGVGVGWLEEEFAALGIPFAQRGARCREYVELIRTLWTEEHPSFDGRFTSLPPARQDPKPIQQPHPPIYFGGESDAALRRIADLGQGWHGFGLDPERTRERVAHLTTLLEERGRRIEEVHITVSPYLSTVEGDDLKRFRDAGVDQVTVLALALAEDQIEATLDQLAESLLVPAGDL